MKTIESNTIISAIRKYFDPNYLGVYLVIAALVWSFSYSTTVAQLHQGTISVTGVAYKTVKANLAEWDLQLEYKDSDRKVSYEQVQVDARKITDFLTKQGIKNGEISSPAYSTQPIYKKIDVYQTSDEITGYSSTAYIRITTADVYIVESATTLLNSFLIDHDITVTTNTASYLYTKLEHVKVELLQRAIVNAKERAVAIGKTTQTAIGKVKNASQGIFQVNRANDYSVSDYGNFDTSSIEKSIRAIASVDFSTN